MEGTMGQIMMWAGNFAPANWAFCDGQLIAIRDNTALFSILGVTYGGNGTTNFALPDFRGRVAIHSGEGQSPDTTMRHLGERSGSETVVLNVGQLPTHTHALLASNTAGSTNDPTNNVIAALPAVTKGYAPVSTPPNSRMAMQAIAPSGSSQPVPVMQPFVAINFIICVRGQFPSRN